MDNQNYPFFNKAYSELGSKYGDKMNHLTDEMLDAELELTNKLIHFRDEMEKYGKLDSKYEKAYAEHVAKMTHLVDEMLAAGFKLNNKLRHLRDEMSAAKIEMNDKLLQLQGEKKDNE